jgi:hypothetical protein
LLFEVGRADSEFTWVACTGWNIGVSSSRDSTSRESCRQLNLKA